VSVGEVTCLLQGKTVRELGEGDWGMRSEGVGAQDARGEKKEEGRRVGKGWMRWMGWMKWKGKRKKDGRQTVRMSLDKSPRKNDRIFAHSVQAQTPQSNQSLVLNAPFSLCCMLCFFVIVCVHSRRPPPPRLSIVSRQSATGSMAGGLSSFPPRFH
jgi:hypothetical protein